MSKIVKIGNEEIYPSQVKAGKSILPILFAYNHSPFLDAECQQGKTGTIIYVTSEMLARAVKQGKSLHVIICIADAKNDLRDQQKERFSHVWGIDEDKPSGAKLDRAFEDACEKAGKRDFYKLDIVHRSELKNLELHDCDWRLFILDECHYAEVKPVDGGELNKFYARAGIDVSKSPRNWTKGRTTNYFLPVSATGFSWLLAARTLGTFEQVRMDLSANYTGLPELEKAKRLHALHGSVMIKVHGSYIASRQFSKEIVPHFLEECENFGNGYCLIRLQGKALQAFKLWCDENGFLYQEATTASGKIQELKNILEGKPTQPTFLIISGIYRAGMTIRDDSNIRMVIEPTAMGSSDSEGIDSLIQSMVGRSMGYNKNNPYPIYCNRTKIEEALKYILELRQNGVKSKKLRILRSKNMTPPQRGKVYTYNFHKSNPIPGKEPRRQSDNKEDFSAFIVAGRKHSSHGNDEVYYIDRLTTKEDKTLAGKVKIGYYTRGAEQESKTSDFVDGAPHTTSIH